MRQSQVIETYRLTRRDELSTSLSKNEVERGLKKPVREPPMPAQQRLAELAERMQKLGPVRLSDEALAMHLAKYPPKSLEAAE